MPIIAIIFSADTFNFFMVFLLVDALKQKHALLGAGKLAYDSKLISRLKGRIVLQVENRGQAWYINPADGQRYYMKDGAAAYQIMRFLSLGITNENIGKIDIGD